MKTNNRVVLDHFNSEIFEIKFANIIDFQNISSVEEVEKLIDFELYDMYSVKIKSTDSDLMYYFQKAGFYVVDCLVTYEFDSVFSKIENKNFSISFAENITALEIENLATIASKVFKIDRFHSDPNLSNERSNEYYYRWVKNSFNGFSDGAILPQIDGKIAGFTTFKINNVNEETSTTVLSAVDPNYMGMGVYGNMIKKGTVELLKHSSKVRVGTQIDNIPVQRTWQRLGYKLVNIEYVLHCYNKA